MWRVGHRFWYRWGAGEVLAEITSITQEPGLPRHYNFRDVDDKVVTGYLTEYGVQTVRSDNPNQEGGI